MENEVYEQTKLWTTGATDYAATYHLQRKKVRRERVYWTCINDLRRVPKVFGAPVLWPQTASKYGYQTENIMGIQGSEEPEYLLAHDATSRAAKV